MNARLLANGVPGPVARYGKSPRSGQVRARARPGNWRSSASPARDTIIM
jgi:hypothetical protein